MTTTDQCSESLRLTQALVEAAMEIASAGHTGWGNVCTDAAAELRRLAEENERLKAKEIKIVGYGVFEDNNLHDFFFGIEEAEEMASYKGSHAFVHPVFYLLQTSEHDRSEIFSPLNAAAPQPAAPTQVEMQWQPIETAPRDGTSVLIYAKPWMVVASWTNEWMGEEITESERSWYIWDGKDVLHAARRELANPTHWMPRPSAPSTPPMDKTPQ